MPTQYDMSIDDDLFRGILEYEYEETELVPNPNYNINSSNWQDRRPKVQVKTGRIIKQEICIGPYASVRPIKTYVTRNRGRQKNLTIKRVEKVAVWEEVSI